MSFLLVLKSMTNPKIKCEICGCVDEIDYVCLGGEYECPQCKNHFRFIGFDANIINAHDIKPKENMRIFKIGDKVKFTVAPFMGTYGNVTEIKRNGEMTIQCGNFEVHNVYYEQIWPA